jgi:hypothetical protein
MQGAWGVPLAVSGVRRLKRLPRSTVRAVQRVNQKSELMLRVIVCNLTLPAA